MYNILLLISGFAISALYIAQIWYPIIGTIFILTFGAAFAAVFVGALVFKLYVYFKEKRHVGKQ